MKRWLATSLALCLLLALARAWPAEQAFDFRAPALAADASLPAAMHDLAARMLPVYQDGNRAEFLSNLSAIQLVAGDSRSAYATRQSLMKLPRAGHVDRPSGQAAVFDLFVHSKAIESDARIAFPAAFARAFHDANQALGNRDAYLLIARLSVPASAYQERLQQALDRLRPTGRIGMPEAVNLVQTYFAYDAYRNISPLISELGSQDNARRYLTERVRVRTGDGARIAATVVRPRAAGRLPALLEFAIDSTRGDAVEAASRGYAQVTAHPRGVGGSSGEFGPFMHVGEDARAVIRWIARRSWSDGSVGMAGCGYGGFVAFAAARQAPPALKTIATCDPMAPGIDFPMRDGIFQNDAYRWALRVDPAAGPEEAQAIAFDDQRWAAFNQAWYASGKSYRHFARIPGKATVLFDRWLSHPSDDAFWRKTLPSRRQLARLHIPILTVTGYFSSGEEGALYYFEAHHRANPAANHTLLIGPYDWHALWGGSSPSVNGVQLDQGAPVDLRELRYQWFDHVLKGGRKPGLLKDRVNYEVMGQGEWRSAPSIRSLGGSCRPKLFLQPRASPDADNALLPTRSATAEVLSQVFRFDRRDENKRDDARRDDANAVAAVAGGRPATANGQLFVGEALAQPLEIAGMWSGQLDFIVNKMDVDFRIALYELTPGGAYIPMFDPPYAFRASYALDRTRRHLLQAGVRQVLPFQAEQMTSRLVPAGSRIVMLLGVNERPDQQLNYGTGDGVSDESIADAAVPLRIRWYNGSFIELPAGKECVEK
jgi:putative CocE/NonD family hydrolase